MKKRRAWSALREFQAEAEQRLAASKAKYGIPDWVLNQQGAQPATLPPGALFGVPGFTQPTEQTENNDGSIVNLASGAQVSSLAQGIGNFKQTDVICWWELDLAMAGTYTAGTSTLTTSGYAPWNVLQSIVLSVQNLFKPIELTAPSAGIDAAIFQVLRPMRQNPYGQNVLFADPFGTSGTGFGAWQATGIAQPNVVSASGWSTATTAYGLSLELPASLYFDIYYHLDKSGQPVRGVAQPQRAIVSPVYMAGAARYVQPQLIWAAGNAPTLDVGPVNIGAGTGTYASGASTLTVRRVGFYGSNDPRTLPPVMNPWQYRRMTTPFNIGGRQRVDIPLQAVSNPGQILLVYVRLWDPTLNTNLGGPIPIANVTKCQLLYGSGLLRFDDKPLQTQRRIMEQHNVLLPQGVLAWDLAMDLYGRITNAYALNTLTTAGVTIHLEFTGAQSASAYAVVGTELLVVVE